jgi:hypothetical protein
MDKTHDTTPPSLTRWAGLFCIANIVFKSNIILLDDVLILILMYNTIKTNE